MDNSISASATGQRKRASSSPPPGADYPIDKVLVCSPRKVVISKYNVTPANNRPKNIFRHCETKNKSKELKIIKKESEKLCNVN